MVVTDRDRDARLDDELRRLAAAAGVAAPTLEVRTDTKRLALVRYSRDGVRLLVRPETLRLPTQVLRGILAHEVAHIARQHSSIRRRMGIASLAAIWATLLAGTIAMVIAILTAPRWLWPAPVAAALCMLILTRATQLDVVRRQEYEADRVAAKLVGSTEPSSHSWTALPRTADTRGRRCGTPRTHRMRRAARRCCGFSRAGCKSPATHSRRRVRGSAWDLDSTACR